MNMKGGEVAHQVQVRVAQSRGPVERGAVDEHVEAVELLLERVEHGGGGGLRLCQVGANGHRAAADGAQLMLERRRLGLAAEVREGDVEPLVRQSLNDRPANALRSAGHE